jgi:RNA polymerase sigma-70 factor, ECF subfamily
MDKAPRLATSTIDPSLLARVAKGDQQAYSQLYDHSSTLLFTLAVRILGNHEEAAELLQDVYLARGYRATSSLEAGQAAQIADLGPSPFETQADQELRIAVGAAMAGLPQAQQQAIELAYYEGLSHAEIAERLNQPLGTVKTRIKLGMSKLRDGLQQWRTHGDLP